jgi:hypothetical protein
VQHRTGVLRIVIVALAIALVSTTVMAALYYYYTAQVQVTVETPKVTWTSGSDVTASTGTNKTWCQIAIGNLEPNATTVYTSALKFTVGVASSSLDGMALQILTVTDNSNIIWGIRFYIFTQGSNSTTLTLVDGSNATISNTDGGSPVAQVGYRQLNAPSGYGSTSAPAQSGSFTGSATTTYIIAIEVIGQDGILTSQTATLQLRLLWS